MTAAELLRVVGEKTKSEGGLAVTWDDLFNVLSGLPESNTVRCPTSFSAEKPNPDPKPDTVPMTTTAVYPFRVRGDGEVICETKPRSDRLDTEPVFNLDLCGWECPLTERLGDGEYELTLTFKKVKS